MISLLKHNLMNKPMLDFGSGTGWISEFLSRMNIQVNAFDINRELDKAINARCKLDARTQRDLITCTIGDGHQMLFENNSFGHILCFDTLHHMHDYHKVFSEFQRVLLPGGRCIFVEPGAGHSTSKETLEFLQLKKTDPTWIERDVILEEMHKLAKECGFNDGVNVVPVSHPLALQVLSSDQWASFRGGDALLRSQYLEQLSKQNYFDRVIFYIDKLGP